MQKQSIIYIAAMIFMAGSSHSQVLPSVGIGDKDIFSSPPERASNPVNVAPLPERRPTTSNSGQVLVKGFSFIGNTVFSSAELQSLVAPYVNQELDIAGFDKAADTISRHYRSLGFSIARAYVPAQKSPDGIVNITVVEGRFGLIQLKNSSDINDARLLQMGAHTQGELIQDKDIERSILLLTDLPGVNAKASLQSGAMSGASDLILEVSNTKRAAYSLGFDNFGSPATGTARLNGSADFNNLNGDGDQLNLNVATTTTVKQSLTGGAAYTVPLGYAGQRVGVSYSRSQYRLGAGFSATQSYGTSNAVSAFTSYPLIRAITNSLYFRTSGELRSGVNNVGASNTSFTSKANVIRLGLSGDALDTLGGGGFTSYGVMLSQGSTSTTDPNDATATGANTAGRFSKINYNLARQQSLFDAFSLYGSLNAQKANKNLDGSEQTGLGGPSSVRGYGGEAGGSTGALGTVELRYTQPANLFDAASNVTLGLFADRGWVQFYQTQPTATPVGAANSRSLSSYGITLTLASQYKAPTATSTGYFLRGVYGVHPASQPSSVDPTSTRKFWLQSGINF